jgi:hypothetical protein
MIGLQNHWQTPGISEQGFVPGNGKLSYGPEQIMEITYGFPGCHRPGMFTAFDLQYISIPGYNRARGPIVVAGVPPHIELCAPYHGNSLRKY